MKKITQETIETLHVFLKNAVFSRNFTKVLLGLSGGIDSAVVAVLCKQALGDNTKVLLMPSNTSSRSSIDDSLLLCEQFDISCEVLPIKEFDTAFRKLYSNANVLERGNFCSRLRMATLYHIAQAEQRLVIGTSNKSELMLGYGTIFGDLASAINPIGNLYKTQIYELAHLLDIPEQILHKVPSADLYEGQSDEDELGYSYAAIDVFLEEYEKCNGNREMLLQFSEDMYTDLNQRIVRNRFKQEMPEICTQV